jgi:hypothetical protein
MIETTVEQATEALRLALQIVERRGDKAVTADPTIWRALIEYAPR